LEQERAAFIDYLRSQLLGPAGGMNEELVESPTARYLTGVLYPPDASMAAATADEDDEDAREDDESESPVSLAFERLPGSGGISFFIEGTGAFTAEVSAAHYVKSKETGRWRRHALAGPALQFDATAGTASERRPCLDGRAELYVIRRRMPTGYLVTATVVNALRREDGGLADPHDCLFQVAMCCTPRDGQIGEYRGLTRTAFDEEEEELELLYRHRPTYAVGHGCAAAWADPGEPVENVAMSFLPQTVVPEMPPTRADSVVLSLQHLSDPAIAPGTLRQELDAFVAEYDVWIDEAEQSIAQLGPRFASAAGRILKRLRIASRRISRGIEVLLQSEENLQAFRLANRAMLMQMVHGRPEYGLFGSGVVRFPVEAVPAGLPVACASVPCGSG
jgi:hypothetical protein